MPRVKGHDTHGAQLPGQLFLSPSKLRLGTQVTETQCLVVLCTCPDGAPAAHLAETLVEERLAACVNRLAGVVSNFHWEGRVQRDTETLLIIKTTRAGLAALTARIRELHPYELPEVLAVPVVGGHGPYLEWLQAGVARSSDA